MGTVTGEESREEVIKEKIHDRFSLLPEAPPCVIFWGERWRGVSGVF
jgi:hypothetical protein